MMDPLKSLKEVGVLNSKNNLILISIDPEENNDWWKQFIIKLTHLPIIKAYRYSKYMVAFCNNLHYTIDLEGGEIMVSSVEHDKFEKRVSKFYNEIEDIPFIKTTLINIIQ